MIITKEKILELQQKDSQDIKEFIIKKLPFHGQDVALERHRPNGERYPVGRPQEPNIRIDIGNFMKKNYFGLKKRNIK